MKKIYNAPEGCKITSTEIVDNQVIVTFEEDKFEPKDGDFVCSISIPSGERCTFIFKHDDGNGKYRCHAGIDGGGNFRIPIRCFDHYSNIDGGYATKEEKQCLLNELNKNGYDWDAENKQVVKKLWRAEAGERYWFVNRINVDWGYGQRSLLSNSHYNDGNYFSTKEEAQKYADKFKEILKNRTL